MVCKENLGEVGRSIRPYPLMYCRLFKPIIFIFNSLEHKKVYYLFYIVYTGVYRFNYDRSIFVWVYSIRSGAAKWLWWWMMSRGAWVLWAPPNLALFGYRCRGPSASIYFTTRQSICTRIWCAAAYISHRFLILWWCSKKCVDVLPVVFVDGAEGNQKPGSWPGRTLFQLVTLGKYWTLIAQEGRSVFGNLILMHGSAASGVATMYWPGFD